MHRSVQLYMELCTFAVGEASVSTLKESVRTGLPDYTPDRPPQDRGQGGSQGKYKKDSERKHRSPREGGTKCSGVQRSIEDENHPVSRRHPGQSHGPPSVNCRYWFTFCTGPLT